MGMYWDITSILPYQRTFNFIVSIRGIGKTYGSQKWFIKQALLRGRETAYIVRTQHDIQRQGLFTAWQKVLQNEYPDVVVTIDHGVLLCDGSPAIHAMPLTQARNLKRNSFPNIYYMMFDEYQIEQGTGKYINDFMEPELFITLYHTIDREEGRVKCFFMGNNASYYNPYHLYPAFGLPREACELEPGKIWKNKTTLFTQAQPSVELMEKKKNDPFLKSLENTRYGEYAVAGKYMDDDYSNIGTVHPKALQIATFRSGGEDFGLYNNALECQLIFTEKRDPSCNWKISLDRADIKNGYTYFRNATPVLRELIQRMYRLGGIAYDSMMTKVKLEPKLISML